MTFISHIVSFYKKLSLTKVLLSTFCFILLVILLRFCTIKSKENNLDYANTNFKVLGLNLPTNLSFAGEKVPLNDVEIKESLEKEFFANKSWKSSSIVLFNKANKWFPIIEKILKEEGIPNDFKYIAMIESHLSNVTSPMGAAGFWQLMPNTASSYGLIVNNEIDERYDIEKSTRAACKHFKEGYAYFNNWTLSAAAYNNGIGAIQKALKTQNTSNYYDLLLNKETGSFIYRILAYKTLLSNPAHFGIKNSLNSAYKFPKLKNINVDSSITNLDAFAKHLNTNTITLKTFNAWLIGDKLTNTNRKVYIFKIPQSKNVDISNYFNDVFPQKNVIDTTSQLLKKDSINSKYIEK